MKGKNIMATRENLSVKVDYLSIVFDTIKVEEVIYILNMSKNWFRVQNGKVKHKEYQKLYRCGQIKIFGDNPCTGKNPLGLGAYLILGGKGCDEATRFIGENFGIFFERIRKLYGANSFHITRIDLAIDDRNAKPFYTIEQIRTKCRKQEFVCKCNKLRFCESGNGKEMANTVYIGAPNSQISYRFYDKDKQVSEAWKQPIEEIGSWKRTEIQLRDDMADTLGREMKGKNISQIAFGLLKEYLRFVIVDKKQKNKSRWKTCQFWERFIGNIEPLKLKLEKEPTSLEDTQRWLRHGGVMSSVKAFLVLEEYKALGSLKSIEELMDGVPYSLELAHKVVTHLMSINRSDLISCIYKDTKKEELSHKNEILHQNSTLDK